MLAFICEPFSDAGGSERRTSDAIHHLVPLVDSKLGVSGHEAEYSASDVL